MKTQPHSISPRALAIAGWAGFAVAGVTFLTLAWNVASHAQLVTIDAKVAAFLHENAAPAFTRFMLVVTHANSTIAMTILGLVFAAVLWRMKERYWLLSLALALGGGMTLNVLLKHAYERARPHFDDPFLTLNTFSFPSGHTAGATLFYGVLAAFLVSRTFDHGLRVLVVTIAVAMVMLVALSRMYLGAHYLSDVLAAACSSTAWLALCLSSVHALVRRRMAMGAA
ncbi:MAG TPA: phosphatase PAP2 family protein [Usitatibacter sp.]|nr:phosphatase PAP2 family protein [Usitatibacter sp.]